MFDGLNIKDLECLENSLQDSDEDKKIGKMSDRRKEFYDKYVSSLISEAKKLKLSEQDIKQMIERGFGSEY